MEDVPVVRLTDTHRVFAQTIELITDLIRRTMAEGHPHLLLDVGDAAFARSA